MSHLLLKERLTNFIIEEEISMWKKIAALMLSLILIASVCSVASAETTTLSGKLTIWAWGADAEAE